MDPNHLARVRLLPGYLRSCTWTYDANDVDAVLADYDRLTAEIAEHAEEVRVLRAGWDGEIAIATEAVNERDNLAAIVVKLPQTADGVPVVPGMNLYYPVKSYSHCRVEAIHSDGTVTLHGVAWDGTTHNAWTQTEASGYSTREAAVAAQAKGASDG